MRKLQDRAPPDDQGSWYDMNGFWPTDRQSYETAYGYSTTTKTASGCAAPVYSFGARTVSHGAYDAHFIVDAAKIWQFQPTGLPTDVTGTAVVPTFQQNLQFAQFGDVTIAPMGVTSTPPSGSPVYAGNPTVYSPSPGNNFANLVNAPQAMLACVQSGCVLLFHTQAYGGGAVTPDGWAASDVFDYTNWTTGESASGRLLTTPGPIYAAVPFRDAVYVFKGEAGGIYKMQYVGGDVKWMTHLEWTGFGCRWWKMAKAGKNGILFLSDTLSYTGSPASLYYWYDGVNEPVLTNPFTNIPSAVGADAGEACIDYDPTQDLFHVYTGNGVVYYFSPKSFAWGKYDTGVTDFVAVDGGLSGGIGFQGVNKSAANTLRFYFLDSKASPCYIQTSKFGRPDRKSKFGRATPIVRRRVDLGTDSVTAELTLFREREDTTAQTTRAGITESTDRKRFDLMGGTHNDNFARVKLTYTSIDVEIDDVAVVATDGGE